MIDREQIIAMAREADLVYWKPNSTFSDGVWWMDAGELGDEIELFAALITAAEKAEEREACAKVCEDIDAEYEGEDVLATWCATAIRARGKTK